MTGFVTIPARSPDFQRTFLAIRYYFGTRGPALADALDGVGVVPVAADVLSGLGHAERSERAKVLGAELGPLATALDRRGLWR